MRVRILCGPDAGEIRNMSFPAARGALRSGTAELVIDPELVPVATKPAPPPQISEPNVEEAELEPEPEPYNHHKRPGRRR